MNKFVCIKNEDKVEIRLGNVQNHSDLVLPKETCTGGGSYIVREDEKLVRLWDSSFDYGHPKFGDKNVVDDSWEGYTFYYLPDLSMPLDDCYKIDVDFEEL